MMACHLTSCRLSERSLRNRHPIAHPNQWAMGAYSENLVINPPYWYPSSRPETNEHSCSPPPLGSSKCQQRQATRAAGWLTEVYWASSSRGPVRRGGQGTDQLVDGAQLLVRVWVSSENWLQMVTFLMFYSSHSSTDKKHIPATAKLVWSNH